MKLQNDTELENTRKKLARLKELIEQKDRTSTRLASHDLSLESMKAMADKLAVEIREYERSHQTA
jgi:hypothetical protein